MAGPATAPPSGPGPTAGSAGTRGGPLYLLFTLDGDRYALAAEEIVELLALQPLKRLPEAPPWVAGLISHRGRAVPVIDLAARHTGRPAARRTSTRLAVVAYPAGPALPPEPLGLILEQATETRRLAEAGFGPTGIDPGPAPYLGAVRAGDKGGSASGDGGMVQRIAVAGLLPADVRALLYPPAGAGAQGRDPG